VFVGRPAVGLSGVVCKKRGELVVGTFVPNTHVGENLSKTSHDVDLFAHVASSNLGVRDLRT
jgi:hypothetical protein